MYTYSCSFFSSMKNPARTPSQLGTSFLFHSLGFRDFLEIEKTILDLSCRLVVPIANWQYLHRELVFVQLNYKCSLLWTKNRFLRTCLIENCQHVTRYPFAANDFWMDCQALEATFPFLSILFCLAYPDSSLKGDTYHYPSAKHA